ncbi:MAG: AraC family transcriptional regulator [Lachnospiraceae bacterium]|nr:AraC family transcriptional regulator [Lachnospiraceae bacterium]
MKEFITNYIINNISPMYICFHNITNDYKTGATPVYHMHDAYEIYLFIHGNLRLYIEDTCYELSPGDMAILNPDELHAVVANENTIYERVGINIKQPVFDNLNTFNTNLLTCFHSHPHAMNNIVHLSKEEMDLFVELCDKLLELQHSDAYGNDLLCYSYLIQLLVMTNTLYKKADSFNYKNLMPQMVIDTMKYVDENLTNEITLDDLSAKFGFNGNYLSSQFKKNTGLTLRNYIIEKRITLAKKLLSQGYSVSAACYNAGFNDYSNFIRTFKKCTGISPGRYKGNTTI